MLTSLIQCSQHLSGMSPWWSFCLPFSRRISKYYAYMLGRWVLSSLEHAYMNNLESCMGHFSPGQSSIYTNVGQQMFIFTLDYNLHYFLYSVAEMKQIQFGPILVFDMFDMVGVLPLLLFYIYYFLFSGSPGGSGFIQHNYLPSCFPSPGIRFVDRETWFF